MSSPSVTIAPVISPQITIGGGGNAPSSAGVGGGNFGFGGGSFGGDRTLRSINQLSGALQGLRGNFLGIFFSSLFTQMGIDRVADAQDRLNAAVEKYGSSSQQAIRAQKDLDQANQLLRLQQVQISMQWVTMGGDLALYGGKLIRTIQLTQMLANATSVAKLAMVAPPIVGLAITAGTMALFASQMAQINSTQSNGGGNSVYINNVNVNQPAQAADVDKLLSQSGALP